MNHKNVGFLCCLVILAVTGCAGPSGTGSFKDIFAPSKDSAGGDPGAAASKDKNGGTDPESISKRLLAMAKLNERRGQFSQAETLCKDAIARTPKNHLAYHRLGVICAKQGKFQEAQEQLARADALKPNDPEVVSDIGYVHYLAHQLPEAERYLRRAMELEPNNLKYSNNLALVLGGMGRDQECLALFRRANSTPQADVNFAFVLAQRGDYDRALAVYDRALTEDRTLRVAADAMIELSKFTSENASSQPLPGAGPDQRALAATPAMARQPQAPFVQPPANTGFDPAENQAPPAQRIASRIPAVGQDVRPQVSAYDLGNAGPAAATVQTASWQASTGPSLRPLPPLSPAVPSTSNVAIGAPAFAAAEQAAQVARQNATYKGNAYPATQLSPGVENPFARQIGPMPPAVSAPIETNWGQPQAAAPQAAIGAY